MIFAEQKNDLNPTTAIMKQMLSLIQKQQRSVALQSNAHFKQQLGEQQRPTSGSLASSTASMDSLNDQNVDFNVSASASGKSPERSATASVTTEKQNNKRLRTTILPEQLNFLYDCYQNESNPSRKMLEEISKKVNLKKRVVQVNSIASTFFFHVFEVLKVNKITINDNLLIGLVPKCPCQGQEEPK